MTSIERTAYPQLKRRPSTQELADVYTPTVEDLAFIRATARGASSTLTLAVLLKVFQRLGHVQRLQDVPFAVVTHVRVEPAASVGYCARRHRPLAAQFARSAFARGLGQTRSTPPTRLSWFRLGYQRGAVTMYREMRVRRGLPLQAVVQAIAIGDTAIAANPFEFFDTPGLEIRQASPSRARRASSANRTIVQATCTEPGTSL